MSKLYFRYGAMNSGKSTLLQQVAFNYEERGMNVFLMKPYVDSKGGSKIVSRLGIERVVDYTLKREEVVPIHLVKDADCIIVDECQFLTAKQVDQLRLVTVLLNIPIICYGLRTDFRGEGFEGSSRLLEIAESIEEMKTICSCGRKATMNGRKVNGEFVFEGEQVCIDNKDEVEYISLCAKCYYTEKSKGGRRNDF